MENGAPTNLVIRCSLFLFTEGYPVDPIFRRDHEDILMRHAVDLVLHLLPADFDATTDDQAEELSFLRRFGQARINAATVDYVRRPGNHLDRQIKSGKFSHPMSRQHEFDEWHSPPERGQQVAEAIEAQ